MLESKMHVINRNKHTDRMLTSRNRMSENLIAFHYLGFPFYALSPLQVKLHSYKILGDLSHNGFEKIYFLDGWANSMTGTEIAAFA